MSPRQKFRNNAINRARVVPSVGVRTLARCNCTMPRWLTLHPSLLQADDSPEYFARLLEGTDKEVLADEMTALRDKLMYQPHAWLDAFIAAKGMTKASLNLTCRSNRNGLSICCSWFTHRPYQPAHYAREEREAAAACK